MAKCWFHLLICFVGIVCGGNGQIVLDDLGLLIRCSGVLILVAVRGGRRALGMVCLLTPRQESLLKRCVREEVGK